MNRLPLVLVFLSLPLAFSSGCLFSKKNRKPKENPAVVAETEEAFRQRFVDKRSAELVERGVAADVARNQAMEEFRVRYSYTTAAKK